MGVSSEGERESEWERKGMRSDQGFQTEREPRCGALFRCGSQ